MPFDYTGSFSGSFTGELTSTNGVISSSAQVSYTQLKNKPTTISAFQANSILANTNFRQTSFVTYSSSISDRLDDAKQTLGLVGTTLSISNGNSVSLANLGAGAGGSSIWDSGSQDPETYTYLESSNNLQLTGSFRVSGGITGSLLGTAATASYALYAISASHEITYETSASHAETADTASFISDTFISASAARSGFGQSDAFPYTGDASITGSLSILHTGLNALRIQATDGIEVVRHDGAFGNPSGTTLGGHIYPGAAGILYNRDGTLATDGGVLGNGAQETFLFAGYNSGTSIGLNTVSDGNVLFISGGLNQTWVGYGTAARDSKLWVRDYLNVEGQISASGGISGSSLWLNGIGDVSASLATAIAASVGSVFPYVGNAQITGSLKLTNVLKVGDLSSVSLPAVEAGMIAYSGSNFYFGIG